MTETAMSITFFLTSQGIRAKMTSDQRIVASINDNIHCKKLKNKINKDWAWINKNGTIVEK